MDQMEIGYLRKHLEDPGHTLSAAAGNALLDALESAQATIAAREARLREAEARTVEIPTISSEECLDLFGPHEIDTIRNTLVWAKEHARLSSPSAPAADRVEAQQIADALAADPINRMCNAEQAETVLVNRELLTVLEEIAHITRPRCKKLDEQALLAATKRLDALRSQGGAT